MDYTKIHNRIDTAIECMEEAQKRIRNRREYAPSDAGEEVKILKSRIAMALKTIRKNYFDTADAPVLEGILDGSLDNTLESIKISTCEHGGTQ